MQLNRVGHTPHFRLLGMRTINWLGSKGNSKCKCIPLCCLVKSGCICFSAFFSLQNVWRVSQQTGTGQKTCIMYILYVRHTLITKHKPTPSPFAPSAPASSSGQLVPPTVDLQRYPNICVVTVLRERIPQPQQISVPYYLLLHMHPYCYACSNCINWPTVLKVQQESVANNRFLYIHVALTLINII